MFAWSWSSLISLLILSNRPQRRLFQRWLWKRNVLFDSNQTGAFVSSKQNKTFEKYVFMPAKRYDRIQRIHSAQSGLNIKYECLWRAFENENLDWRNILSCLPSAPSQMTQWLHKWFFTLWIDFSAPLNGTQKFKMISPKVQPFWNYIFKKLTQVF